MMHLTPDTTLPDGVDPHDQVSLEYQVEALSRKAALAAIAQVSSFHVKFRRPPSPRPQSLRELQDLFRSYQHHMEKHLPYEEMLALLESRHARCPHLERSVYSWTVNVLASEASQEHVALWRWDSHTSQKRPFDTIQAAYLVHLQGNAGVIVAPQHVIRHARWESPRTLDDLGRRSANDTPALLETMVGLYDPDSGGTLQSPRSALQAARLMHRSEGTVL